MLSDLEWFLDRIRKFRVETPGLFQPRAIVCNPVGVDSESGVG